MIKRGMQRMNSGIKSNIGKNMIKGGMQRMNPGIKSNI
jgi:hypothetical protein